MRIYLAGPIDMVVDRGADWRDTLKKNMNGNKSVVFFDPVVPYHFNGITPSISAYIHDINMFALYESDVVVARIMKDQVSIGTPIELYEAIKKNKPIILITDMDTSVYMNYIGSRSIKVDNVYDVGTKIVELQRTCKCGGMDAPDGTQHQCILKKIDEDSSRLLKQLEKPGSNLSGELMKDDYGNLVPVSLRKLKFVGDKKEDEE